MGTKTALMVLTKKTALGMCTDEEFRCTDGLTFLLLSIVMLMNIEHCPDAMDEKNCSEITFIKKKGLE